MSKSEPNGSRGILAGMLRGYGPEMLIGEIKHAAPERAQMPASIHEPCHANHNDKRMSLSWIKHKIRTDPQPRLSVPDTSAVVTESLLMELDTQIQEIGQLLKEKELAQKREKSGVDYTWLMNRPSKPYQMPQVERFELEELCAKVLPTECGRVIEVFRVSLMREPPVQEIPRILRSIIIQTLEERPKEDDSSWISKSLVNLRAKTSSNRIVPVSMDQEEMEMGSSNSTASSSTTTDPVFTITNEMNL